MNTAADANLEKKAFQLFDNVIEGWRRNHGFGCMSCSIYDTAWVAMLSKVIDGQHQWVFPACFQYVVDTQTPGGGWKSYASEIDGILNTSTALLSLRRHAENPYQLQSMHPEDLVTRITTATESLRAQLLRWDVEATDHVGFEILVPAILELLAKDRADFEFPGRELLLSIRNKKLSQFHPSLLYGSSNIMATVVHSLEGLIGRVDFNRLKHRKSFGSMMASPSSTVAYLLNCNIWDDESEAYLRRTIEHGQGQGSGGVPSAYPSTYFEATWLVSTLLDAGYDLRANCEESTVMFIHLIQDAFRQENGLIGFAPLVGVDADDSAKGISSLNMLGAQTSPERLVEQFDAPECFRTFPSERNPSFTANCNILKALVSSPSPEVYSQQIEKVARYICSLWSHSNGPIRDKWNLSIYYPMMLMAQALQQVLTAWDRGCVSSIPEELIMDQIVVVLLQALVRTLRFQNSNGSWGENDSYEESAYATILLNTLADLPCAQLFRRSTDSAKERGQAFITQAERQLQGPEYLWIEKVTYGSQIISQAYILAALKRTPFEQTEIKWKAAKLFDLPMQKIEMFVGFYSQLPMFSSVPEWFLPAALVEGYLFLPQLRRVRLNVFQRQNMAEDKYFEYIPFTWAAANGLDKSYLGTEYLYHMNVISFLNYQADEYMEAVVGEHFSDHLDEIRGMINETLNYESLNSDIGELETADSGINGTRKLEGINAPEEINGANGTNEIRCGNGVQNNVFSEATNTTAIATTKPFLVEHQNNAIIKVENNDTPSEQRRMEDRNGPLNSNETTTEIASPAAEKTVQSLPPVQDHHSISDVRDTLHRFAHHVLAHPGIQHANPADKRWLRHEIRTFLLGHVTQIEDSRRLYPSSASQITGTTPHTPFITWVRGVAADHTSCPYSFAFASCLLSSSQSTKPAASLFPTTAARYLVQATARHLASMCRMYNDYGSISRDRLERNLNSVDFAEIGGAGCDDDDDDTSAQKTLMQLAELERGFLEDVRGKLEAKEELAGVARRFLAGFIRVTDMYGQIYVRRDIASEMK